MDKGRGLQNGSGGEVVRVVRVPRMNTEQAGGEKGYS